MALPISSVLYLFLLNNYSPSQANAFYSRLGGCNVFSVVHSHIHHYHHISSQSVFFFLFGIYFYILLCILLTGCFYLFSSLPPICALHPSRRLIHRNHALSLIMDSPQFISRIPLWIKILNISLSIGLRTTRAHTQTQATVENQLHQVILPTSLTPLIHGLHASTYLHQVNHIRGSFFSHITFHVFERVGPTEFLMPRNKDCAHTSHFPCPLHDYFHPLIFVVPSPTTLNSSTQHVNISPSITSSHVNSLKSPTTFFQLLKYKIDRAEASLEISLGDGSTINFWSHNWLPYSQPRPPDELVFKSKRTPPSFITQQAITEFDVWNSTQKSSYSTGVPTSSNMSMTPSSFSRFACLTDVSWYVQDSYFGFSWVPKITPIPFVIHQATIDQNIWENAQNPSYSAVQPTSSITSMVHGSCDMYTCLADASWCSQYDYMGFGWVLMDPHHKQVLQGKGCSKFIEKATQAEAFALREAVIHLRRLGYKNVKFQGDAKEIYDAPVLKYRMQGNVTNNHHFSTIEDVLHICKQKDANYQFEYISIDQNSAADKLAKEGRSTKSSLVIRWTE